ncbi:hypothetical protein V6N11_066735 [Hibiscus sabdariffa]|uniref:Uncharacterized protein n=1 Tax=Hibiscus sabdariffa TaxID=183260 RepID=A0ABR2SNT7_9ROSI
MTNSSDLSVGGDGDGSVRSERFFSNKKDSGGSSSANVCSLDSTSSSSVVGSDSLTSKLASGSMSSNSCPQCLHVSTVGSPVFPFAARTVNANTKVQAGVTKSASLEVPRVLTRSQQDLSFNCTGSGALSSRGGVNLSSDSTEDAIQTHVASRGNTVISPDSGNVVGVEQVPVASTMAGNSDLEDSLLPAADVSLGLDPDVGGASDARSSGQSDDVAVVREVPGVEGTSGDRGSGQLNDATVGPDSSGSVDPGSSSSRSEQLLVDVPSVVHDSVALESVDNNSLCQNQ